MHREAAAAETNPSSSLVRGISASREVFEWETGAMAGLRGQEASRVEEGEGGEFGNKQTIISGEPKKSEAPLPTGQTQKIVMELQTGLGLQMPQARAEVHLQT